MGDTGTGIGQEGLFAAVEQAADGIVIVDAAGTIRYVNPAFTVMTGYSREEAVGRNPRFLKSGRHPLAFYQEMWSTILSRRVWHGEVTNRRKDGTFYDEEMRIAPVCDEKGATTGYIAIKQDVTEQRAREAARAFLAAIVEHSEDAIIATTPAGSIVTWNRGAEVLLGFAAQQAVGQDVSLFAAPDSAPQMAWCIGQVAQGQTLANHESVCRHANGRRVEVAVTGFPIRDAADHVVAATVVLRDTTERNRAEQKLRESEARFRMMADSSPSMMWVSDARGELEFINRAYRKFFAVTCEEVRTAGWQRLIHPEDASAYVAAFERATRERVSFEAEARVRRADGEWRLLGSRAEPRRSADGQFLGHIGLSADITERRLAEQEVRGSREFAQSTIDALSSHICVLDETGMIIAVNRAWRDFGQANPKVQPHAVEADLQCPDRYNEGTNYLEVCDRTVGPKPSRPPNLQRVSGLFCGENVKSSRRSIHAIPFVNSDGS